MKGCALTTLFVVIAVVGCPAPIETIPDGLYIGDHATVTEATLNNEVLDRQSHTTAEAVLVESGVPQLAEGGTFIVGDCVVSIVPGTVEVVGSNAAVTFLMTFRLTELGIEGRGFGIRTLSYHDGILQDVATAVVCTPYEPLLDGVFCLRIDQRAELRK